MRRPQRCRPAGASAYLCQRPSHAASSPTCVLARPRPLSRLPSARSGVDPPCSRPLPRRTSSSASHLTGQPRPPPQPAAPVGPLGDLEGDHRSLVFCLLELLMGSDSNTKATIKLVKLDKALKLAETWVCNMSESITDETNAYEYQARPSRLGLGAEVIPSVNVVSNSHAERLFLS
ncbi:hypothetical protein J5N97_023053 [Dioscorea zingiberensis]|uniref:Uncharacterized protein n=1 Tax=Dioscorea zingiberensis TaxID=325984 RepID=A0A9D5CBA6_9LILI|nr:hypothetical protein J5N97_023053 [Dioscorea zingiberensis]